MNGYWITGIASVAVGMALGGVAMHIYDGRALAVEQAAHAKDNAAHLGDLLNVSRAALDGEQRAIDANIKAQDAVAAVDAQFTKEKETHETDNHNYRAALAAGTERVRVAVRNCSAAGGGDVPGVASAPGLGDGRTAIADLDPAVAERAFGVAGDDQREIDKLKAVQGYVCAVRPETQGCTHAQP